MNLDWDAKKYSTDFSYVHESGADLLDLIDGRGGRVLDLGCGNGVLTRKLSEAGFRAEGMDNSEPLLCTARASYPELPFFLGDAADFHPSEPYDIVFSNAVFHWIPRDRQQDMLRCIYDALHRHGQLIFEMGGSGIFRPEVTKSLGIDEPVLAWGLGIDRMAMMHLGINDIRDLFSPNIDSVRTRRGN